MAAVHVDIRSGTDGAAASRHAAILPACDFAEEAADHGAAAAEGAEATQRVSRHRAVHFAAEAAEHGAGAVAADAAGHDAVAAEGAEEASGRAVKQHRAVAFAAEVLGHDAVDAEGAEEAPGRAGRQRAVAFAAEATLHGAAAAEGAEAQRRAARHRAIAFAAEAAEHDAVAAESEESPARAASLPADAAAAECLEPQEGSISHLQRLSFSSSMSKRGSRELGAKLAERQPVTTPVDAESVHPSRWERFLAGEVVCSCCAFCFFLALMLLLTIGGLYGGFKLSDTGGTVLSSDIVHRGGGLRREAPRRAWLQPREGLRLPSLQPLLGRCWRGRQWGRRSPDGGRRQASVCSRERHPDHVRGSGATGTGCPGDDCDARSKNLLTERNMNAMKKFEDTLFGSRDFQDDYCLLWHPASGGDPVCTPPTSMLAQLYSDGPEVPETVKESFDAGFGNALGACMCSLTGEPSLACAPPAGPPQGPPSGQETPQDQVLTCLKGRPDHLALLPESAHGDPVATEAHLSSAMEDFCASMEAQDASWRFAPPFLSPMCSSTAWDHTEHGSAQPLQGDALRGFLEEVCSPDNPLMSPLRRFVLPSFACQGGFLAEHGTPFLMSMWMMGHDGHNQAELEAEYTGKLWNLYQEASKEAISDTNGEVRPMLLTEFTALKSMESLLIHDCALAIGSFLLVFFYMWFTIESFFLSSMGMLQVVMSCPPAFLVWKFIRPDGVGFLQFLTIFMILGIGADDIFVLVDAWKQAPVALDGMGTTADTFALGYRRAFSAMLTTTATTGAAFFFGAFNPVPAVSHFCLFACIVVVFDFLWCVSFFASSLCVYERFFMGHPCLCFGPQKPAGSCGGPGCCWGGFRRLIAAFKKPEPARATRRRSMKGEPWLERFCAGPLFSFVLRYRVSLVALWLLATAASGSAAGVLLKTATKPPEIGDEENDLVRFFAIMRDYFSIQEQQLVQVSWGLPEESAVSRFTSTNPITPEVNLLDRGAELLTTPASQQAALALCRSPDSAGARCESDLCLVYGSPGACLDERTAHGNVSLPTDPYCATGRYCFMKDWVEEYANINGIGFPVPDVDFVPLLESDGFRSYLEERRVANQQAGRHWDNTLEQTHTGWIIEDGTLKFAWMTFNASFKAQGTKDVLNRWHERWGDHVRTQAGVSDPRHSSKMYEFMVLQNELLSAAIQGILVSLFVTAVVLALVTFNWVLALIGLLNISVITVIFLGVMPLIPWELGSNECIFLIAVVGLAVDYSVHLLHAYNEHEAGTREEKMQGALGTMGISVASGAITTMGAGLTLFQCDIAFFQQYGSWCVFRLPAIFLVILISLVAALTNLPPLLLLMGPEGDRGKIALLYWLAERRDAGVAVARSGATIARRTVAARLSPGGSSGEAQGARPSRARCECGDSVFTNSGETE
ncbi:unnamed protein product [Prorocentrum cordatum]|uniref:SSD domain-containing protein n=2 Tax=Prorocentrum cordatum TaxID=2364126 RepID=A0ABN9XR46_9DINO|nr:unnamed protein product [Polarella glacialis]